MKLYLTTILAIVATVVHGQEQKVIVLGNQQQGPSNGQQPVTGQESVASDLLSTIQSTLNGFLPSFQLPNLSQSLPCLGLTSLTSGRCMSSASCELSGGSDDKGCLTGGHVCCIASSKCGSVISSADAWISNDEYPNATATGQSCVYTINKASPLIGQLRIELDKVELASSLNCDQDRLVIDDVTTTNLFPICGLASGGHLIIPFTSNSLTLRVVISDKVVAVEGIKADGNVVIEKVPRKWRLRLTQFANNGPNVAPAGCTQLFNADGSIKSLGQGMNVKSGQKYAICFQSKPGMCGLRFDLSSLKPKGLLEQLFTAVEQPKLPQPMDNLPLQPPQTMDGHGEGHNVHKRQVALPLNPLAANPLLTANLNGNNLLAPLQPILDLQTNLLRQLGLAPPAPVAPANAQPAVQVNGQPAAVNGQQLVNANGQPLVNANGQPLVLANGQPVKPTAAPDNVLVPNIIQPANGQALNGQQPNLLDPLGLQQTIAQLLLQKEQLLADLLNAKKQVVVEKVAPPPPPTPKPYHQAYGNSIYHQPAQHHNHYQGHQPAAPQPWQHAHKPAYGYGTPMPEPAPAPLPPKQFVVEKVVEVPQFNQLNPNPQVQNTLNIETGIPGLLDLNNSITLGLPKTLEQGLLAPLAPLLPVVDPAKVPVVSNQALPDGTITRGVVNLNNPLNPGVVIQRSKRSDDGQSSNGQDGQSSNGDGQDEKSVVKCTRTMFLAPTSASNGGHIVCLEEGKYNGPSEVIVIGEPLVAFIEIAASNANDDQASELASASWNIPFSFVPC